MDSIIELNKVNLKGGKKKLANLMLRGRIIQKYGSVKNIAEPLGLSYLTVTYKINGSRDWTVSEIEKLCRLLEIAPKDIPAYFFTNEVE